MDKRQFRFKTELFSINGVFNIPGLIICSGHGYSFETYCCKNCGEIFIVDVSDFRNQKPKLVNPSIDMTCPGCGNNLANGVIKYPENVFYKGSILENNNKIDKSHFEETELRDAYILPL